MPKAVALITTDLARSRLGLASRLEQRIGGVSVLEHTVRRVARVPSVRAIVIVHPEGQQPLSLLGDRKFGKPLSTHTAPGLLDDAYYPMRCSARKWALEAWRGGLAGAGPYDELLPAADLVEAMDGHKAGSALLVGADWMLVDPDYCDLVLQRHLENPEAMAFTFSQAPPGLAAVAVGRDLLAQLDEKKGLIGQMLSYKPTAPQADPIGRDPCIQIDSEVRSLRHRFIYDTDRSAALIDAVAARMGEKLKTAGASAIAAVIRHLEKSRDGFGALPQQVTIELTPQRPSTGPIVPQHHIDLERKPMPLAVALRIVEQLGESGDIALTLGGLGDALLHEDWPQVVCAAHEAGVLGIAVQTDLLVDKVTLERLLELPIDVISVRLNADTAKLYERGMGADRFKQVVENLHWLLSERQERGESGGSNGHRPPGLPWIVPHMVKSHETLPDMETFFDRWVHFAGCAVIEPAKTGCGLVPPMSPVAMAPPRRRSCRQIGHRMTILSDGRVARCDQDWLGRASDGDAACTSLREIWKTMNVVRKAHREERWLDLDLCPSCVEWHRP